MTKKTVSKRLAGALDRHQRWLRRRGVRPPGRRDREKWAREYQEMLTSGVMPERLMIEPLAGGADACADRSLMSRLHREHRRTRDEILRKAKMVAPAFNKGGLQYLTGKD